VKIECVIKMNKTLSLKSSIQIEPIIISGEMKITTNQFSENAVKYGPKDKPFNGYFRLKVPYIFKSGYYLTKNIHYQAND